MSLQCYCNDKVCAITRHQKVGGIQMIEIATVRNELDRTSGKLKDFRGSL